MASNSGGGSGYESPMVRQELAKLDKGGEKRRSALVSLRACVEKLDATSMPRFLSQVSDARDLVTDSRSYAISLYQDVARVHGRLIAPHIPRIMITISRTLSSSGSSIHLHEACSKVVASLLRYAISPLGAYSETEAIFREVCNPLLEVLTGKIEPLAAGAAICLQAVVESDKWKYAPQDLVVDLYSKASMALKDRTGQTLGHLQLARSLVRAGAVSPDCGVALLRAATDMLRANSLAWQQKAAALQLVRALLLSLDKKSLVAETESIGHIIEQIRRDRMPHVRNEAVKALQALKAQVTDENPRLSDAVMDLRSSSSSVRSRSFVWEQRGELSSTTSTSQESQLIAFSPPAPASPESSSPVLRERYPRASSRARRTSSSSSISDDTLDSFQPDDPGVDEPEFKDNIKAVPEASEDHAHTRALEDSVSCESCVIDEAEDGTPNIFGEIPATARSTSGRYGLVEQSPDTALTTTTTIVEDGTAKFSSSTGITPERKSCSVLTVEDFVKYTTPRRLVRSLQALVSSPDSDSDEKVVETTMDEDEEMEASCETAWSVRDNPIAEQDLFSRRQQQHNRGESGDRLFQDDEAETREASPPASAKKSIKSAMKTKTKSSKILERSREWLETLLGGLLILVLLLPVAMAVLMLVFDARASNEGFGLVPT